MYSPLPESTQNILPVLQFDNVSFTWPGGHGLKNVSFSVPKGQFVLISGPSGAGKSTLLRLAVRLEEAQEGTILLKGVPITTFYPPTLRTHIGFLHQTPILIEGTVKDNLLLPFRLQSRKNVPAPTDDVLQNWMDRLALSHIPLDSDAHALSVGQKQRVCLIRSVLPNPDVICFDEPTSSLDKESRERVEAIAEELAAQGTSILMVNHTSYHPTCPHMHLSVQDGNVEVLA